TAYDVVVSDALPAGFNWAASGGEALTCETRDGDLVCTIDALPAGTSVDILVTAPTNVASCGTVTNVVSVEAGNEPGSAGENNTAEASVTITCPPDKPGEP